MREAGQFRLECLFVLLGGIAAGGSICSQAHAAQPVSVQVGQCEDFERDSMVRLLRIEMAERLVNDPAESGVDITLDCRPLGVLIRVSNRENQALERMVTTEEARGQVGARVVALKAVELLREWENRGAVAVSKRTAPNVTTTEKSKYRVLLAAELLSVNLQAPFYGVELSFEAVGFRPFYGRLGVGYLATSRRYDEGRVAARVLAGRVEFGLRDEMNWFAWGGGLGYRLGDALLEGEAVLAEQTVGRVRGLWGGPSSELFIEMQGEDHFLAKLNVEGGLSVHKVSGTVSGHSDLDLDKPWLSVSLGLGAHW